MCIPVKALHSVIYAMLHNWALVSIFIFLALLIILHNHQDLIRQFILFRYQAYINCRGKIIGTILLANKNWYVFSKYSYDSFSLSLIATASGYVAKNISSSLSIKNKSGDSFIRRGDKYSIIFPKIDKGSLNTHNYLSNPFPNSMNSLLCLVENIMRLSNMVPKQFSPSAAIISVISFRIPRVVLKREDNLAIYFSLRMVLIFG